MGQILDAELPAARQTNPAPAKHSAREVQAPPTPPTEDLTLKKRKRDDIDEADPKLQEFLEVMDPKHAAKRQREDAGVQGDVNMAPAPVEDGESDGEYEEIPAKTSKSVVKEVLAVVHDDMVPPPQAARETIAPDPAPDSAEAVKEVPEIGATDDDWLRSRTNRLLDLVDPDDPTFATRNTAVVDASQPPRIPTTGRPRHEEAQHDTTVDNKDEPAEPEDGDTAETLIQKTARVFVRNLPYTATEDNLRTRFQSFGAIEEVCKPSSSCLSPSWLAPPT